MITQLFYWRTNTKRFFFPQRQSKCFWKKLCLSFLLAQNSCQDYSERFETDDKRLRASPFCFSVSISPISSWKNRGERIVIFSSSVWVFCMIMECGACLGLKLEVLSSGIIFLFIFFYRFHYLSFWMLLTLQQAHMKF